MLEAAPLADALRELAADGHAVFFDRYAYRSIALRHVLPPKVPAPLFAAESGVLGTRFVPPNRPIASLYLAWEAETAHREGNQAHYQAVEKAGVDFSGVAPPDEVALIGVRIRARALLDVRSAGVRDRVGTTEDELRSRWKTVTDAPTQRLGEAVYRAGAFEGMIYQSAQNPCGSCLVLFPDRHGPGSSVEFKSKAPGVPDARLAGPPALPA